MGINQTKQLIKEAQSEVNIVTLGAAPRVIENIYMQMVSELQRLDELINSPHTANFLESVRLEVAHQINRWSTVHDRSKDPEQWYWLVGYLAGKALRAHIDGDEKKALHHTISTGAALANWHTHIQQVDTRFNPGVSDLEEYLIDTFGRPFVEGDKQA